ncbi:tetratricopeptide repeat protein [Algoriphagus aestuariicola]|uniref:Tetratricopeptide repeat protein n=1 Tax=Algoriphagus aestuariicola TaxID=1852016 RepID=A0ABS3BK66_9BACT|nr:tetratricopeptide repeat protein [Algoriphagus aestuariicola]MBN7799553.1 tetratricopeptide repeat protein [Algoriphagus aestuariicola]
MCRLTLILFLTLVAPLVFGQKVVDSLRSELTRSSLPDSLRVDLYNELAFTYAGINPILGHAYADSALDLAREKGMSSRAISAINYHGVNYWYQGEDSLALVAYRQVLEAHRESGNRKGQASATNNIALIEYRNGNYREALEAHEAATKIFEELGLRKNMINSLTNTGVVFLALADYPNAQEYFLKALGKTEPEDIWERANSFNNLGLIEKNLGSYEEAESNYLQALELYRQTENVQSEASALGNLSAVAQLQGKFRESEAYIRQALALNKTIGNSRRIASDYANWGTLALEMDQPQLADAYLDSARSLYLEAGEKLSLSTVYLELARAKKALGLPASISLSLEREALRYAEESGSLDAQRSAWAALSSSLERSGDFRESLAAFRKFSQFQDSIFNDENERKLLRSKIGYEFEAREKQLTASFETDRKLLEAEREQERLKAGLYLALAIGIVLVAVLVIFLLRMQAKSKRVKLESEFRARSAELELKALKAQMNPHFIFNALSSISSFLLKNQPEEADRYLTRFSRLIRRILEYSDRAEITLSEEVGLLKDYIAIEALRLGKKVDFSIVLEEGVDGDSLLMPPLILQPLVENSLWHGIANTSSDGEIILKVFRQESSYLLVLRDNGAGLREAVQVEQKHQSMGMYLVESRLESLHRDRPNSAWSLLRESLASGFEVRLTFTPREKLSTI